MKSPSEALAKPLPVTLDSAPEEVLEALMFFEQRLKAAKEAVKAYKEEELLPWLKEHGPLELGETVWYVGKERKVRLDDRVGLLERLGRECLTSEELAVYLAANPYRQGAVKERLGEDEWSKYFHVEEDEKAKYKAQSRPKRLPGVSK